MTDAPKTATVPVSSGSGTVTVSPNAAAVAAGDFAYGQLGSGTAGGMGNAALLSTTTILPNTQRTQISKAQLEAADKEYTRQMNLLSNFWTQGDTTSDAYNAQKQSSMQSQYQWELARNNLEEVAVNERADLTELTPVDLSADLDLPISLDLTPVDLSSALGEPESDDIVVTGTRTDTRVRLRPKVQTGATFPFFGDESSVLYMLNETRGVFFPYTPTITMNHKANYQELSLTHANTSYHVYTNTPAVQIQIQGQFSAQNLAEAKYTLAAMHFFRSATKMHFGKYDDNAGLPPPMLVLSGYGEFMFNDLNVILTDFSMDLPNNVDYLEVTIGEGDAATVAWVPSLTTFTVSCVVQQTPKQQREEFNLDDFVSGKMFGHGGEHSADKGWI